MSSFLNVADNIKARLDAELDAATNGITVIVDRQKDILSEVNKAVGKAKGAAITILFTGFRRINAIKQASYAVRIWCKPVINNGANLADNLAESCDTALHRWIPPSQNSAQDNCHFQITIVDVDLVPDRNFLIYELTATCNVK